MQTDIQLHELFPIMIAASGTIMGSFLSFFLAQRIRKTDIAFLIACAAGMMTGCSFVLLEESFRLSSTEVGLLSFASGFALMKLLDMICTKYLDADSFEFTNLHGQKAIRLFIMVIGLMLHSIGEGLSLGLSAISNNGKIVYTSLAIHNIPESAALAFAFRSKGTSVWYSFILSILSNSPQSLMAIPSLSFFSSYSSYVQYGMGMASGCMLYAVLYDIFPEAVEAATAASKGYSGDGVRKVYLVSIISCLMVISFDLVSHIQFR